MKKRIYKGMPLDLTQTVYLGSHVPIIYCYMKFDTRIDVDRLKQAVRCTIKIVPQLVCRYDDRKNIWYSKDYDINSLVRIVSENNCNKEMRWDLRTGPQLKINLCHQSGGDRMQVGISHILTDGAGFRQYLSLLCRFYNGHHLPSASPENKRSIMPLLYHTAIKRIQQGHKRIPKGNIPAIFLSQSDYRRLQNLKVTLTEEQVKMLKKKAAKLRVTLNDIFMASYACVLQEITLQEEIVIPCPADLRKYDNQKHKLTIANMTGKYLCRISFKGKPGLEKTVLAVHEEMKRLQSRYASFHLVQSLQILSAILPDRVLRIVMKHWYTIEPTSYTNMGVIDEHKVFFQGTSVKECYLCGTYRRAPAFQVSISTYKNICTLSANILGSEDERIAGMQLLEKMKACLLKF